ncbi:MAG: TonB-dependent receptor, partial [Pseudomonadota bacterium]
NASSDASTQAIFFQQNFSFRDQVILTFGLRQDFLDLSETNNFTGVTESDDFSETSLRAALTYKVTDEISTYASYVESVAPPTIGIEPERGDQIEFGIKYAPRAINALFSASIYELNRTDITIPVALPGGAIVQQTIGENRVRGFDFEAKVDVTERFSLTAAYAYTDTEVTNGVVFGTDVTGNEFASVPTNSASIWATYTVPAQGRRGRFTAGLGGRYIGEFFFDAFNQPVAPGLSARSEDAFIVDASLSYEIVKDAELSIFVSNLFDEQHVVGRGTADFFNPGREIAVTLRKSF